MLGTVDHSSAHATAHAGAVYLHQGETWLVTELDLDESVAVVVPRGPRLLDLGPRDHRHRDPRRARRRSPWGEARLSLGDVRVSHQVVSFLKRTVPSRRGDRRGAARPARAASSRPPRCGGRCPTTSSPSRASPRPTCPAPPTRPSTPRSACCRCSRPATAGTSAASPPPCTPTPAGSRSSSTTATRAGPASPSAASTPPAAWLRATREAIASCACTDGLPLVRAVAEVRQPEQPARQTRRDRAARPPARGALPARLGSTLQSTSRRGSRPVFVAALIVLIVAVLLVIAALFGGGDPTTIDMGSFNVNGPRRWSSSPAWARCCSSCSAC